MPSIYSHPSGVFNNSAYQQNPIQGTDDLQPVKKLILNDLRYSILASSNATAKYLRERSQSKELSIAQPLKTSLNNVLCTTDSIERKLTLIRQLNDVESRLRKDPNEEPMQSQKKNKELRDIMSSGLVHLKNLKQRLKDREQKSLTNHDGSAESDEFIDEKEEAVIIEEDNFIHEEKALVQNEKASAVQQEVVDQNEEAITTEEEEIVDQQDESTVEKPVSSKKKPARRKRLSWSKKKR